MNHIHSIVLYKLLNGGNPNNSGLKSKSVSKTKVASFLNSRKTSFAGTITVCIPARVAPVIPFGASSNTRH